MSSGSLVLVDQAAQDRFSAGAPAARRSSPGPRGTSGQPAFSRSACWPSRGRTPTGLSCCACASCDRAPRTGNPAFRLPPVFSSPTAPGWNMGRFSFCPGLRAPRLPAAQPGRRRAITHWPGYYTPGLSRASSGASHLNSCTLTSHVVAGGLHHHPGHPQAAQVAGHAQRRPGHRGVRLHLLQPPLRPASSGTRTQHTSSALPISSAATRAMISSLSCVCGHLACLALD